MRSIPGPPRAEKLSKPRPVPPKPKKGPLDIPRAHRLRSPEDFISASREKEMLATQKLEELRSRRRSIFESINRPGKGPMDGLMMVRPSAPKKSPSPVPAGGRGASPRAAPRKPAPVVEEEKFPDKAPDKPKEITLGEKLLAAKLSKRASPDVERQPKRTRQPDPEPSVIAPPQEEPTIVVLPKERQPKRARQRSPTPDPEPIASPPQEEPKIVVPPKERQPKRKLATYHKTSTRHISS